MKYNSNEISDILFEEQILLYNLIDTLLNQKFNELQPDIISNLTTTLIELDDKIQLYIKELKQKEMYH